MDDSVNNSIFDDSAEKVTRYLPQNMEGTVVSEMVSLGGAHCRISQGFFQNNKRTKPLSTKYASVGILPLCVVELRCISCSLNRA